MVFEINQDFVEKFNFFEYKTMNDVYKNLKEFMRIDTLLQIIKKCLHKP